MNVFCSEIMARMDCINLCNLWISAHNVQTDNLTWSLTTTVSIWVVGLIQKQTAFNSDVLIGVYFVNMSHNVTCTRLWPPQRLIDRILFDGLALDILKFKALASELYHQSLPCASDRFKKKTTHDHSNAISSTRKTREKFMSWKTGEKSKAKNRCGQF